MKSEWKNGLQAPLAALVVVLLFAAFNFKCIQSSADVAAWVQGIGSLLAIVAALVIYARQYADKKADDVAETRAFVQAICDELRTAWDGYNLEVHPALTVLPPGEAFDFTYPVTAEPFPIFRGNTVKVGKVDDAELRHAIVKTYALARGLLDSFTLNNGLVVEYARLKAIGPVTSNINTANHRGKMAAYAGKLKERDEWVERAKNDLLARADAWLAANPPR